MTISEGAHTVGGTVTETGIEDAYATRNWEASATLISQEIKQRSGVNVIYQHLPT
jgi:hypothetical protein